MRDIKAVILSLVITITTLVITSSVVLAAGSGGGGSGDSNGGSSNNNAGQYNTSQYFPETLSSETLSKLKCGEFSKMRDRIACRLGLSEKEIAGELQLLYLPEECREIANVKEKEECVSTYAKLQKCWKYPVGKTRLNCVKEQLGILSIAVAKQACSAKEGLYKAQCMQKVNENIYRLIKFRFYDLEERAEELMKAGVNKTLVIDLVTALEEKKLQFNEASSKEKRRKIILEVRDLWKKFAEKVGEERKNSKLQ